MNPYQEAIARIIELEDLNAALVQKIEADAVVSGLRWDENAELKRERDHFKAGHIRYRTLYRAECDRLDGLLITAERLEAKASLAHGQSVDLGNQLRATFALLSEARDLLVITALESPLRKNIAELVERIDEFYPRGE